MLLPTTTLAPITAPSLAFFAAPSAPAAARNPPAPLTSAPPLFQSLSLNILKKIGQYSY